MIKKIDFFKTLRSTREETYWDRKYDCRIAGDELGIMDWILYMVFAPFTYTDTYSNMYLYDTGVCSTNTNTTMILVFAPFTCAGAPNWKLRSTVRAAVVHFWVLLVCLNKKTNNSLIWSGCFCQTKQVLLVSLAKKIDNCIPYFGSQN